MKWTADIFNCTQYTCVSVAALLGLRWLSRKFANLARHTNYKESGFDHKSKQLINCEIGWIVIDQCSKFNWSKAILIFGIHRQAQAIISTQGQLTMASVRETPRSIIGTHQVVRVYPTRRIIVELKQAKTPTESQFIYDGGKYR